MTALLKPMLAESVSPAKLLKYAEDDCWRFEQKLDGHRLMVQVQDGTVSAFNRQGEPKAAALAKAVTTVFECLEGGPWVFDGELVDNVFWLFDLPLAVDIITPGTPYGRRRDVLDRFYAGLNAGPGVRLLPSVAESVAKVQLAKSLLVFGAEGVMMKDATAPYEPGHRSRRILKAKFTKTVDCIVARVSPDGKESVSLAVYGADGHLVEIGKSSTIGKPDCKAGDVLEIRYLYVVDPRNPRLYQPTILAVRDDKAPQECTIDQLVYTNRSVLTL